MDGIWGARSGTAFVTTRTVGGFSCVRNLSLTQSLTSLLIMSARWLTATEQEAWRLFISVLPDLMAALEIDLAPHGLTLGDYEVLVRLSESDDLQLRMCDLAAALRLSPSGLTRRLDGLVKAGWVERAACPDDRRVTYARVTEQGMRTLRNAAPDHVESVRRHLVDPIGNSGMRDLRRIFATVRDTLLAEQLA